MKRLLVACFIALCFASQAGAALDLSVFSVKGFEGKGPLEFNTPEDLLLLDNDMIVVADQRNNRLQLLNKDGEFIRAIPQLIASEPAKTEKGTKSTVKSPPKIASDAASIEAQNQYFADLQRTFRRPTGMAIDHNGRLYVTLMESDIIVIVNISSGKITGTLGKSGRGQGEFYAPMDIDISQDGRIAVAEARNKRVQILSAEGKCLKELIYQEESKKGRFNAVAPRGVHWNSANNLVVSYPGFNQIVCWEPKGGTILWRYGTSKGSDKGMLNSPSFITDATDGHLLISDSGNNRIVEITGDGRFFEHHGRRGSAPGRLLSPRGLALNRDETLAIADQGNNRIHLFQPGQTTLMLREAKQLAIKDDWRAAITKIERILYLQPDNEQARDLMVNALYFFGNQAFSEGNYDKSEEYYRRILKYRPDDPNIPQKLDAIFWAANQGLIASIVFGIIAVIVGLILVWILKVLITRFIFTQSQG